MFGKEEDKEEYTNILTAQDMLRHESILLGGGSGRIQENPAINYQEYKEKYIKTYGRPLGTQKHSLGSDFDIDRDIHTRMNLILIRMNSIKDELQTLTNEVSKLTSNVNDTKHKRRTLLKDKDDSSTNE